MTTEVELVSLVNVMGKVEVGNKCEVWRGQVVGQKRRMSQAYVKHLPPRAIFVECVAAQIGRSLGLSIPRPMLVRVEPVRMPQLKLNGPTIFFGSEDVSYPSLQQFVPVSEALEQLKKWPDIIKAGCFDEWIANADRHQGNILYNGRNQFSLIDHSHAFPRELLPEQATPHNSLLKLTAPPEGDEVGMRRVVKRADREVPPFLELAQHDWTTITQSARYCDSSKAGQIVDFLNTRLKTLSVLIAEQLGEKQQDLYAAG